MGTCFALRARFALSYGLMLLPHTSKPALAGDPIAHTPDLIPSY